MVTSFNQRLGGNDVQLQDAAAVMLQGLTAQYLLDGTVRLERNDTVPTSDYPNVYLIQHLKTCFSDLRSPTRARQVLVHAAAGGTGRLIVQASWDCCPRPLQHNVGAASGCKASWFESHRNGLHKGARETCVTFRCILVTSTVAFCYYVVAMHLSLVEFEEELFKTHVSCFYLFRGGLLMVFQAKAAVATAAGAASTQSPSDARAVQFAARL